MLDALSRAGVGVVERAEAGVLLVEEDPTGTKDLDDDFSAFVVVMAFPDSSSACVMVMSPRLSNRDGLDDGDDDDT